MTDARDAHVGHSNPALHAAAACAPAILWTAVGCPFDVIKTRLQTAAVPFASPLQCLRWTVRREGAAALWKGFAPQLIASTPYSMIMFSTYGLFLSDATEFAGHLGGCFLAGVSIRSICTPFSVSLFSFSRCLLFWQL